MKCETKYVTTDLKSLPTLNRPRSGRLEIWNGNAFQNGSSGSSLHLGRTECT